MATFDPNKMASFRGDEDAASPTTIIFKQMQAAGIPLSAGNIQKFMQGIRSSPDTPGMLDRAAGGNFDFETGGQDQRPAALRVERGSDDSAPKTGGRPPPPDSGRSSDVSGPGAVNPANTTTNDKNADTSAQPPPTDLPIDPMSGATSAAGPGGVDTGLGPGGKMGLGAMILAGAQAIPGLIDKIRGTPSPLASAAPADPGPQITVPPPVAPPEAPPSDMELAMRKAIAPAPGVGLGVVPPVGSGVGSPTDIPLQVPEVPFKSNPASRVPQADVTVRPRIPLGGRTPRFFVPHG